MMVPTPTPTPTPTPASPVPDGLEAGARPPATVAAARRLALERRSQVFILAGRLLTEPPREQCVIVFPSGAVRWGAPASIGRVGPTW